MSRLKLATAGASHKSGTDSNCRRFAREVVGDQVYEDRTIHITTGDGWFFKILSTQLNDMLPTIIGQRKKVILEYTPDKICNLYGYTETDSERIQRICLGEMDIIRKNRIAVAVAKGKATRARNKIAKAAAEKARAAAEPEARKALILGRAERIRLRNNAILTVAAEAAAVPAIAPAIASAAVPAVVPAPAMTLKEFNSKFNLSGGLRAKALAAAAAEDLAEEEADDDEDEDEDVFEILSQKAIDQINDGRNSRAASIARSPPSSFASPLRSFASPTQSQSGLGGAGGGSARKTRKRNQRKRNRNRKTRKV